MLRKHAALIIAICLCAVVAAACVVRSGPRRSYQGQPVYVEKHKKQKKHKKHKKHRKHR
jgi:coenzyme F420-reducing hydrogenase gamma subunit